MIRVFANLMRRINVDHLTYCWNWKGYKINDGYGRATFHGKSRLAHRISKYLFGEMTENEFNDPKVVVRHDCDNPACINPDHLKIGTQQDNIRDRQLKGRTAKHLNRRDNLGRFK